MVEINIFNPDKKPTLAEKKSVVDFLFDNLEQYRDPRQDIEKAVDYALKETNSFGGLIVTAKLRSKIIGGVVLNQTGMEDYIPENILVYIATHKNYRGRGIGKKIIQKTLSSCEGDVALHVEKDNPARFLYEKIGFSAPYVEMRYKKEE